MDRSITNALSTILACVVIILFARAHKTNADIVYLENTFQIDVSDGLFGEDHVRYQPGFGVFAHSDQASATDSLAAANYTGQTSLHSVSFDISFQHQVRDREHQGYSQSWGALAFRLDTDAELTMAGSYNYFITGNETFADFTLNVSRDLAGTPITVPLWSGWDRVYAHEMDTSGRIAISDVLLLLSGETYRFGFSAGLWTSFLPPPTMRMLEGSGQLSLQLREIPEPGMARVVLVLTGLFIRRFRGPLGQPPISTHQS